jgi:HK97 family phage portal protein
MWPFNRQAAETRASLENPSVPLSDVGAWRTLMNEWHGVAGVTVTYETALEVPAIWCAVNVLAGTIASLPLQVFKKDATGRELADSDTLYGILHDAPNEELTSFSWRKGMMISTLLRGRGVSFIERNKAGRVMNLWPLETDKLTVERKDGRKVYTYRDGTRTVEYKASEVIDLVFMLRPDGVTHVDPISKLRGVVGLSLALEQHAQKHFLNGGVPPLALYGPMKSPASATRASSDVTQAIREANSERRNVLIMPDGHELKPVGIDPDKSQMEEARRFQIEEVARVFSIPPSFLQDLTNGSFANTEQQDLAFTKHTLGPWLKLWEQELNLKLFTARNKSKFCEFNVDGLLRSDVTARFEAYATGIQNAIYTPNEVRAMENWPTQPGEADKLHIQGATVPLGMQSMSTATPPPAKIKKDKPA